jgi:hypothetical protein
MDVDLATDLHALPPMVEALISGGFDIATGSRLLKRSLTNRSLKRDIISRVYNLVVRLLFRTHISDFQCGFKALTRQAADDLLPIVVDNGWFFDTELLLFAERFGYRVFDLPVRWRENTDSRVRILQTAIADLQGLFRVYNTFASGKYPARQRSSARVYETRETPASATSRECWSSQRRETL